MMVDSGSSIQKVDSGDSIVAFQPDPPPFFNSIGPRLPVRRVCFHGEFSEDNRAWRSRERSDADNPKLRDYCTVPVLSDVLATRQLLPTDSDMFGLEYLPAEPWSPS